MLVSVVIPSYNHAPYVLDAIRSVLKQTWHPIELIVIDDGSTDGSADIIEGYWEKHGRNFTFIRRENRGLVYTLNQALNMANGELFCELASDDYFPNDSIELRASHLSTHPDSVAIFANGLLIDKDGNVLGDVFGEKKQSIIFESKDPVKSILEGNFPVFSTCLFRKDVLLQSGGFDTDNFFYYEDLEAPLRLFLAGDVNFLDVPVIFRREHETNVSKTTDYVRVEKVALYGKLLKDPLFQPYKSVIINSFNREYFKLLRCLSKGLLVEYPRTKHILTKYKKNPSLMDFRTWYYLFKCRKKGLSL